MRQGPTAQDEPGCLKSTPVYSADDLRPTGYDRGVRYFKRHKDPSTGRLPKLGPMEADPATVQEVVALARRAGIIPEHWVADGRMPDASVPLSFDDAEEAIDAIERAVYEFTLPRQEGQRRFLDVWCGAADLMGRLAAVAHPYDVPVYSGGGFDGLKPKRHAAERAAQRDVPTVVLHIGDYDLHGGWIFQAVAEDVAAWLPHYAGSLMSPWNPSGWSVSTAEDGTVTIGETDDGGPVLEIRRFAVTDDHVREGMVELDEEGKAEADGMPASWDILAEELDELLDPACREDVIDREREEQDRLRELLAERWSA